jgi:enoyl-CoA hydratase/carnithine racemase
MSTEQMIARKEDGVGWMVFNNPERHNAITPAMWEAIVEILADFEADPEVRVCVMKGAGEKAFVSGADIAQLPGGPPQPAPTRAAGGSQAFNALADFKKPLIAMIRGWCLGGGVAVAMKADFRIAADDMRIGIPAAKLGVGYPVDSIKELVALVGPSAAKLVLFAAERLDASQALKAGLVDEVVPPDALEARVRELAGLISENAPLTIRAAKATIDHIVRGSGDEEALMKMSRDCYASADFQEGKTAFMEKRKPVFQGR